MRKTIAAIPAVACLAGLFSLLPLSTASAASCETFAEAPYREGNTAIGVGGKAGSCSASNITVSIFHKTWRWDDELTKVGANGVTSITLYAYAVPHSGWEIYTKAQDFSGSTVLSATVGWE